MSSNVPLNEKTPIALAVADVPACGPSRTSTLAPATGLNALSYTTPFNWIPVGCGTGEGADGEREPLQPASPWASIKTTIPDNILITTPDETGDEVSGDTERRKKRTASGGGASRLESGALKPVHLASTEIAQAPALLGQPRREKLALESLGCRDSNHRATP
jgi:hypothetical protein